MADAFNSLAKSNDGDILDLLNTCLSELAGELSPSQISRIRDMKKQWDFYEGYHYEDIDTPDKIQVTKNYIRPFVNKFVSFELGHGFKINVDPKDKMKDLKQNQLEYIEKVWEKSNRDQLLIEMGQSKSITGDAWLQVKYYEEEDPFSDSKEGYVRVMCVPTHIVFPEYDPYDYTKLVRLVIAYPIEKTQKGNMLIRKEKTKRVIYKQVWTKDNVSIYEGGELIESIPNSYGIIPFVQIKNFPIAGRSYGSGDIDDLIPINMEIDLKTSDVSEIIDYHASPVTVVYGAKISNLERGANKIWGGLPKDSKVENLTMGTDLATSNNYISELKNSMHDIGSLPVGALGGQQAISNTSGVALQFIYSPLIDRTSTKRGITEKGLEQTNKIILKISEAHKLISRPDSVSKEDWYDNKVTIPDNLPKDELIELQKLQQELTMGIESKKGACRRTNKDYDVVQGEIDEQKQKDFESAQKYNIPQGGNLGNQPQLNSGMTNGNTPIEEVRKEITGSNGMNK